MTARDSPKPQKAQRKRDVFEAMRVAFAIALYESGKSPKDVDTAIAGWRRCYEEAT